MHLFSVLFFDLDVSCENWTVNMDVHSQIALEARRTKFFVTARPWWFDWHCHSSFETLKTYGKTVNQKTQENTFLKYTGLIRVSYLITGDVVSKTQERFQEKNKGLCTSAFSVSIENTCHIPKNYVSSENAFLIRTRFQSAVLFVHICSLYIHLRVSGFSLGFSENTNAFPSLFGVLPGNTNTFP